MKAIKTGFLVKTVTILSVMAFASSVMAQSSILTDKQACYDQAKKYVTDKNTNTGNGKDDSGFKLDQAHYDSKTQTCYVQTSRVTSIEVRIINRT